MTINIAFEQEQQQRSQEGLAAYNDHIHEEAGLNTDTYSTGYFEGYIGMEPKHPEDHIYWSGYEVGSREHWAKKLEVEIPTEF